MDNPKKQVDYSWLLTWKTHNWSKEKNAWVERPVVMPPNDMSDAYVCHGPEKKPPKVFESLCIVRIQNGNLVRRGRWW